MKEQVENFLKTEKERINASDRKKREEHLVGIGLVDKEKMTRIYYHEDTHGYLQANGTVLFDEERNQYYKENAVALDVTNEEYIEICKYFPPSQKVEIPNNNAENTLNVVTIIVLIGGIIGALICLFTITWNEVSTGKYSWETETVFNPMGLVTALSILLGSLTIWASLTVLRNISINLKEINSRQ